MSTEMNQVAEETHVAPLAPPTRAPEPRCAERGLSSPPPLAGEGLGEGGVSAEAPAVLPLPNPSPARGEGLNTVRLGCGSWVDPCGAVGATDWRPQAPQELCRSYTVATL